MGAAFFAVGVGSAGAAVLAMSLLAGDPPGDAPEREIIESATAVEASPADAPTETAEPIFKELIPTAPAPAATVAMAGMPASSPSAKELAALAAGDPRFAHDASAARGIEDLSDLSETDELETAFVPMKRPSKTPFDGIERREPADVVAAAPPPPPKAEAPVDSVKGSGKSPVGTALMTDDANIRSRPKKGSTVIGTVPARTQVQLVGCQSWCEIIVKGKRGFVWGEFVQRGQSRSKAKFSVTKASAKADDGDKPEIVPATETAPHPDQNKIR